MLLKKTKHIEGQDGSQYYETSEVWVADFGQDHSDISKELHEEVLKLKPLAPKNFSWMLTALILLVIIVSSELAIRYIAGISFWSENILYWTTWVWRLILVALWLLLANMKWRLPSEKMFASTFSAFVIGVLIMAIIKIVYIKSAWTWLNLFVEPIWMAFIVALLGSLFSKLNKNKINI
ncbi:hypothetical protein C0580_02030 [Candidatus Parcubacteria bacterium]|nr:MAG: hypothetical protein C0580_02030 [Candidatus Parcubacteria bacterium]